MRNHAYCFVVYLAVASLLLVLTSCVVAPPPAPGLKRPHHKAHWVAGHWGMRHGHRVWIPGHFK